MYYDFVMIDVESISDVLKISGVEYYRFNQLIAIVVITHDRFRNGIHSKSMTSSQPQGVARFPPCEKNSESLTPKCIVYFLLKPIDFKELSNVVL